jgi:hypothetical protein
MMDVDARSNASHSDMTAPVGEAGMRWVATTMVVVVVLLVISGASVRGAQEPTDEGPVKVFLDCQTFGCDFDLVRREIAWVDWVRDRDDADVHLLVSSTQSGAGTVYDIQYLGRERFEGEDSSQTYSSSSTDTQDERRRALVERFKLGLVGYARETPVADFLRVEYTVPAVVAAVTPENDPWNLWVFAVSAGGSARAQSLTSSVSVNGSLSANRTSENWKFRWGARANNREDEFEFTDGSKTTSIRRTSGTDVLVVRSAGPHWGVGGRASVTSSTFSNQDIRVNIQPAFEYNIFPYADSSRRQLTFQYRIGASRVRYDEETIFGTLEETLYEQMLTASLSLRQPWGSTSLSLTASHFLDDTQKNRLSLFGNANVRIVRGLSVNFFGNFSRVRDQVFLPRRGASDEEVLLRQRDLATDFDFNLNVSLRFTFGSIFNNIVNPRFDSGGGQVFFFN